MKCKLKLNRMFERIKEKTNTGFTKIQIFLKKLRMPDESIFSLSHPQVFMGKETLDCKQEEKPKEFAVQAWSLYVLEPDEVYHFSIRLAVKERSIISEILPFQIESLLPFPIQECAYTKLFEEKHGEESSVFVAVCRRARIKKIIKTKEPTAICSPALALWHFHCRYLHKAKVEPRSLYILRRKQCVWLVDIGPTGVRRSHVIDILSGQEKDFSAVSLEIKRTVMSWKIEHTCLVHGFSKNEREKMTIPIQSLDLLDEDQKYLDILYLGALHIKNFHPNSEDFLMSGGFYPETKQSFRIASVLSNFCFKLALILIILASSISAFHYQQIYRSTSAILKSGKLSGLNRENVEMMSLKEKQEAVLSSLERATAPYDIEPSIPTPLQLMQWITKSAQLSTDQNLEIENFRMQLESYPNLEKKSKPYRMKVEITLKASENKSVEKFQENLLKWKWVDRSKAVRWSAVGESGYRITVYMKTLAKRKL